MKTMRSWIVSCHTIRRSTMGYISTITASSYYSSSSSSGSLSSLPQLRIVAFNDVYELDHLPHVQTIIRQYRPQMVVLAGDFISPSTLSSIDGGNGMITTLRSIGLTHLCLGNHEADITSLSKLYHQLLKFGPKVTILNSNIARGSFVPMLSPTNNNHHPTFEQQQQQQELIQKQLQQTPAWLRGVQPPTETDNVNHVVQSTNTTTTTKSSSSSIPSTTTTTTTLSSSTTTTFLPEYSIVTTPCQRVRIGLMGLLSDEPNIFRDNTFRGAPIANVLQTYEQMYHTLVAPSSSVSVSSTTAKTPLAHMIIPITHQSIARDTELAQRMIDISNTNGIIIGGHDHIPYNVLVTAEGVAATSESNLPNHTLLSDPSNDQHHHNMTAPSVQILKSGCNAETVHVIDLTFDLSTKEILVDRQVELIEVQKYPPSVIVSKIVQEQKSILTALETEDIVPTSTAESLLPPGAILSSKGTRYRQTTVGALFCTAIKEELEVDVAMINGATIKGETDYSTTSMSYAALKKELPYPTKMIVVPMKRWELHDAIHYSRTRNPDMTPEEEMYNQYFRNQGSNRTYNSNNDSNHNNNNNNIPKSSSSSSTAPPLSTRIERKGYLQVDTEFDRIGFHTGHQDDDLMVALPRNLLNGFCNIVPLMQLGERLKQQNLYHSIDDDQYIRAIDLIVRHFCKERWWEMIHELQFTDIDTEHKGYISRSDVQRILTQSMGGHEPASFVIDDMIAAMDVDENGVIDAGEFSYLLATMERERNLTPIRFD